MYKPNKIDNYHLYDYPIVNLLLIDSIVRHRLSSLNSTSTAFIGVILEENKRFMQIQHKEYNIKINNTDKKKLKLCEIWLIEPECILK